MRPAVSTRRIRPQRGFSLVEVLVALIIVAVGLLGIAKMDALVLSNSGISRQRALIGLEAESLAATMHADRDYWDSAPAGLKVTVTPDTAPYVQATDATLESAISAMLPNAPFSPTVTGGGGSPVGCEQGGPQAPCSPVNMAAYDLTLWAQDKTGPVQSPIAGATTNVTCNPLNAVTTCTIVITWNENTVNANTQELQAQLQSGTNVFQKQTYELVVQP